VMRTGSGAVLLVGFALVVMLLSVAGALTSPAIGMKQDPSQDFADIAASIRQITYACKNFGGDEGDKESYYDATLGALSEQLSEKGILLDYLPIVIPDENNSVVCAVVYALQSNDKSTYITGLASSDASLESELREYLAGGSSGSSPALIIMPSVLCFSDKKQGKYFVDICFGGICHKDKKKEGRHFLMFNLEPTRINATLTYTGNDKLQDWYVYLTSIKGKKKGSGIYFYDNNNDNVIEFYLNSSLNYSTSTQGKRAKKPQPQIPVGVGYIKIKHSGGSGLIGNLTVTVPDYNFEQNIPIYWNECPVTKKQVKEELKALLKALIKSFRPGG